MRLKYRHSSLLDGDKRSLTTTFVLKVQRQERVVGKDMAALDEP